MNVICMMCFSVIISYICSLFGGWSSSLTTLCIFMLIDFLSGIILSSVFKKSPKSINGGLSSAAATRGFFKKIAYLMIVVVGYQIDKITESTFIKDSIIIFFISNESLSIVENIGLMGVPLPKYLINVIDVLKERSDYFD